MAEVHVSRKRQVQKQRAISAGVGPVLVGAVREMEISLSAGSDTSLPRSQSLSPAKSRSRSPSPIRAMREALQGRFKRRTPSQVLHNPRNAEELVAELQRHPDVDINIHNEWHDAPLHSIIKKRCQGKKEKQEKFQLLVSVLTYSDVDIDLQAADGMTALHFAAEACDYDSACVLIAFGADVNVLDTYHKTPLDFVEGPGRFMHRQSSVAPTILISTSPNPDVDQVLTSNSVDTEETKVHPYLDLDLKSKSFGEETQVRQYYTGGIGFEYTHQSNVEKLATLLKSAGAKRGKDVETSRNRAVTQVKSSTETLAKEGVPIALRFLKEPGVDWTSELAALYTHLGSSIEEQVANITTPLTRPQADKAMLITEQLKELRMCKKGGSRILFVDGGGIRGLIEIEILSQIEKATGKRITELFDWIVGTSTGGILVLCLVYAKNSLREVRQLYFKLKEQIFGKSRAGMAYDTDALERLLQETLGEDVHMNDVKYPKVLIAAVNKKTTNPKLHFFNNCFDDEFSTQPVWKVARCTSAAPMFFTEFEDYVDGGVMANNPCDLGLTRIQEFYRERGQKLPISLIVSVGSGKCPEKELGNVDAQEFLYFGKIWFDLKQHVKDRAGNLITLLSNALVESETVARNFRTRCWEQGVPFYRFNPELDEEIASGETDSEALVHMLLQTKKQFLQHKDFIEMTLRLHSLGDVKRKMHHKLSLRRESYRLGL